MKASDEPLAEVGEVKSSTEMLTESSCDIQRNVGEELFRKAVDIVNKTGRASVTHLQRNMGIGYNRAAQLFDLLLERGVVCEANG